MKYFLDTEFLEGTQSKIIGKSKPTIDLISIGIVCEDGRKYYAISKDFNFKEAWNRYDVAEQTAFEKQNDFKGRKIYWIRDNILLPIHYELAKQTLNFKYTFFEWKNIITDRENGIYGDRHYKTLKKLIKKYGKSNKQIAKDVIEFCSSIEYNEENTIVLASYGNKLCTYTPTRDNPEFYGYYSGYDWVVFCWLFGKMIDLPRGFPMYCIDLKQSLDQKFPDGTYQMSYAEKFGETLNIHRESESIYTHPWYPEQKNEHNALADAEWNYELYKFIEKIID